MQAFEVEFVPSQAPPLRIKDAIPAEKIPHPHISVGDPATPGKGVRVPLTARLTVPGNDGEIVIGRAGAYRDPTSGRIVLGKEPAGDGNDPRALVRLAAWSSFPEGVSVVLEKEVHVLAKGEIRNGQQLLLIWPDGGKVVVEDLAREERYELRRAGDQFDRVVL
jgi:hypothetical protein